MKKYRIAESATVYALVYAKSKKQALALYNGDSDYCEGEDITFEFDIDYDGDETIKEIK